MKTEWGRLGDAPLGRICTRPSMPRCPTRRSSSSQTARRLTATRAPTADPPIAIRHLALQTCLDARPDVVILAGRIHVCGDEFLNAGDQPAQDAPGAFDDAHVIEHSYEAFQSGEVDRVGAIVYLLWVSGTLREHPKSRLKLKGRVRVPELLEWNFGADFWAR